jgi:glycerol uptake facilitator-like aquaporin
MDPKLRTYLAELAGTFIVVLVGAGTVCASSLTQPPLRVTDFALAEGFALAVALTVTFYVSLGCLNPAVTLMHWVFRRLDGRQTVALILAQLLGAALAGLVLRVGFAEDVLRDARLGTPHLKSFFGPGDQLVPGSLVSGTAVELFATFVVTLALFASLFDRRAPRLGGVLAGLAQVAVILFGFNLTGGSGNPARWLGPAVWEATLPRPEAMPRWSDALVYAGGPVLGALAAAFVYHALILPPEKRLEHRR